MPRFEYRALRASGGEIAGELVADDEREAAARLQALGSYPIAIAAPADGRRLRRSAPRIRRLATHELVLVTRQLATLIGAGVALDRGLGLIAAGPGRHAGRALARDLLAAINRGESLSAACRSHAALPPHCAMIIAAGEARGDVAAALQRLAEIAERNQATARALRDALIYPAGILVMTCASLAFLLGFVVPRFEALLTSVQREPPLAMAVLLALAAAFQQLALPAAIVALAAMGWIALRHRDPVFRLALHRRLLGLPGFGPLIGKLEAERLLYVLGNLLSAGVRLPEALAATRAAMTSETCRAALALTQQGVERGDGLAAAFATGAILPEMAGELVRVGEESGDLAPMMLKAGDMLRREVETATAGLIALITPLSIIVLGLLIGTVAVAILGTVMEVYDLAL
jgi:general secretion pathway protein F